MHALAATAALALAAAMPTVVFAQGAYPERPITFIVPQSAGGANDTIARIVTKRLSEVLKTPTIVDNRTGAGGNIGTSLASKAKPDGYTLLFTTNSAQVINPSLYSSPGFDAVKDFVPVATTAVAGYVLVANPSFPANNVADVVSLAKKAASGPLQYASAGNGTLNHLIAVMFEKTAGFNWTHIPYKSASAAATDVVGGQVPLSFQSVPSSIGFIQTGKLKVLATVNEKRLPAFPNVPTLAETYPGLSSTPWYGILAPAGTPKAIIDKLQAAIFEALDSKEVQDSLAAQGCEVLKRDSTAFASMIKAELPQWARIVKESGAKVD